MEVDSVQLGCEVELDAFGDDRADCLDELLF